MIVWISECPNVVGGFATVTRHMLDYLKDITPAASVCFGARRVVRADGYNIYPYVQPVEHLIDRIERDYQGSIKAVVVHGSPWTEPYSVVLQDLQPFREQFPVLGYFVHEAVALPPDVEAYFQPGNYVDAVITPTRATAELAHAGSYYVVPHGVDPEVWKPVPYKLDRFTVAMVASNYIRKRWDLFFTVIARLLRDGHDVQGFAWVPRSGFWWLDRLIWAVEHEERQKLRLILPKPYDVAFGVEDRALARLVGMTHAYLHMTMGEAWGLPIGEALAAGLPTAAVDYPAIREWAGKYIHLIRPAGRHVNPDGLVYLMPSVDDAVGWLKEVIENYDEHAGRVLDARERIAKELSWERAGREMASVLSKFV